ncbi:MAG: hypothetical protein P8P84_15715 [Paracoccaceae bacterium]|nr:hypothetical protein [Paracoccaceae bacterium]
MPNNVCDFIDMLTVSNVVRPPHFPFLCIARELLFLGSPHKAAVPPFKILSNGDGFVTQKRWNGYLVNQNFLKLKKHRLDNAEIAEWFPFTH